MIITTDNETILRSVLDEWKAAVDAHDPQRAAAIFTNDAIFQGLQGPGTGAQVGEALTGHTGPVLAVSTLPAGGPTGHPDRRTLLATAGDDGTVRVWDPATAATPRLMASEARSSSRRSPPRPPS
jgi:WD40 repeat protein